MFRNTVSAIVLALTCLAGPAQAQQFGGVKITNLYTTPAKVYYTEPGKQRRYVGEVSGRKISNLLAAPYGTVVEVYGDTFSGSFIVKNQSNGITFDPATAVKPKTQTTPQANTGPAVTLSEFETELAMMINKFRRENSTPGNPLPPFRVVSLLSKAAKAHSQEMARTGKLDHMINGVGAAERMINVGYVFVDGGENLAFAQETPEAVIKSWSQSPPHRRGMLHTIHTEIGVGVVKDPRGSGYLWTVKFAKPKGQPTQLAVMAKLTTTANDRKNKPRIERGELSGQNNSAVHEGRYWAQPIIPSEKGRTYNLSIEATFPVHMYLPGGISGDGPNGKVSFDYTATGEEMYIGIITIGKGVTGKYTLTITPR